MTKLELVTREVWRIVRENSPNFHKTRMINEPELAFFGFNTISGRHEFECFFAIEFEQEQVDAWTTVQNIIDDVMNLWVSPITDPVVKGANLETVQRLQRQLGESEKAFEERVKIAVKPGDYLSAIATFKDGPLSLNNVELKEDELYRIEPLKSGIVDHVGEEAVMPPHQNNPLFVDVPENPPIYRIENGHLMVAAAKNPSEVINRIEREDVDAYRGYVTQHNALDRYQRIATKSAIYPGKGTPFGLMYAALGLAEAGEVQNKVKKAFRDDGVIQMDQQWVAKWYGSEPGKGCSIWSVNEHGLPSEMLFHVGPDEKDLETGQRICEAHNASHAVRYRNLTPERRAQIIKELGGVLWYIAAVCDEINATMSEVALTNLDELCGRGERNTLRGDGDNR